jgi:hypothetical protein
VTVERRFGKFLVATCIRKVVVTPTSVVLKEGGCKTHGCAVAHSQPARIEFVLAVPVVMKPNAVIEPELINV